jgi:septal ring factor EnvC (AmiA/AmiB activator)
MPSPINVNEYFYEMLLEIVGDEIKTDIEKEREIENIIIDELINEGILKKEDKRSEENDKRREENRKYREEFDTRMEEGQKRMEKLLKKYDKTDKEIINVNEIKIIKHELITQKTVIESLQKMIFELLKRIENLLNNKEVQNSDNSVNIQMEEITKPRQLGFF